MKYCSAVVLATLCCSVSLTGCSFIKKTVGLSADGNSGGGDAARERSAAGPAAAGESSGSPLAVGPVAAAPDVGDSVPPIPDSLRTKPAQGAPVIELAGVSWCSDQVKGLDWGDRVESNYKNALKAVDNVHLSAIDQFSEIARFACGGKQSADRMTWVQSYMQARANATGMTQEHQMHLLAVAATMDSLAIRRFENEKPEQCSQWKPSSRAGELERTYATARSIGLGCATGGVARYMLWAMDHGAVIDSEVVKVGWLYSTYAYSADAVTFAQGSMALRDAASFDDSKYLGELAELGAEPAVVARSLLVFYQFKNKFAGWQAFHQEELGEDFAGLMEAAEAGFASWESNYAKYSDQIDYAFAIEEALEQGGKDKLAGCADKTRAAVVELLRASGATTTEEFLAAVARPTSSLIVASAYECERALGNELEALVYARMLSEAPLARGPRFATMLSLVPVVAKLESDNKRFPLRARDFVPPVPTGSTFGAVGYISRTQFANGIIATAKAEGELVRVTFKKVTWKEPVYKCKETNRIDRITADGTLVYRQLCHQTGVRTVESRTEPVLVPKAAAGGIKPGHFLSAYRDEQDPSRGLPREVYKTDKRKKLLYYFGIAAN